MATLRSFFTSRRTSRRARSDSTAPSQLQTAPLELNSQAELTSHRKEPPLDTTDQLFPDPPLDEAQQGEYEYPVGDFRNATNDEVNDVKCDVMVNHLHAQQEERLWTTGEDGEGVILKKSRGDYTCAPVDLVDERSGLFHAVTSLNVKVTFPHSQWLLSNTEPRLP